MNSSRCVQLRTKSSTCGPTNTSREHIERAVACSRIDRGTMHPLYLSLGMRAAAATDAAAVNKSVRGLPLNFRRRPTGPWRTTTLLPVNRLVSNEGAFLLSFFILKYFHVIIDQGLWNYTNSLFHCLASIISITLENFPSYCPCTLNN